MGIYRNHSGDLDKAGWYRDAQSAWKRMRLWLIHIGGWETPDWTASGFAYRWQLSTIRRAWRARGHRSRLFALYSSVCPLSLFGGRITFQSFGVGYYSRRIKGWYCLHYQFTDKGTRKRWYAYRSYNATPWGADTWYFGAPADVVRAATNHAAQHLADDAERASRVSTLHREAIEP